jgi:hypothetical protein
VIWNKLLKVGRPKKTGNQVCPICKNLGFSYRNTVKISKTNTYFYIRFRHNERTLKDHDIDRIVKEKEPLKHATEYNRMSNQLATFAFNPYRNNIKYYPIKHHNQHEATPIVIYNVKETSIPSQLKDKLNQIAITEMEKDWVLNSEPVKTQFRVNQFYNEILNSSGIITFGHNALEYEENLRKIPFVGNLIYKTDKFGMFGEILKMREKKEKLSQSCRKAYNYPQHSLTL